MGNSAIKKRKKILIVGGGIAGVTLAAFLKDSEYDVTIVERAREWRTIGYAIGIWANGLQILKKLNLPQSFWDKFESVESGSIIDFSTKPISTITKKMVGKDTLAGKIEREELHKVLIQKIPSSVHVRFGITCTDFRQEKDAVIVTFSDNSQQVFDLVAGADGMRSQVREKVFGDYLEYYGWHFILSWVPRSLDLYSDYYILNTPGRVILAIPYGDRLSIGFATPKQVGETADDIFKSFGGINPRITGLLASFDRNNLFYDDLKYVKMAKWHLGRVVLIGDARHGMSPISGFGTSLALGDAYELAVALKEHYSVDDALAVFAKGRNKSTRNIFRFAYFMESFLMMKSRVLVTLRNLLFQTDASRIAAYVLRRAIESSE